MPHPTATFMHPLMGANFLTLLRAYSRQGGVSWRCWPQAACFLAASVARSPITWLERAMMSRKDGMKTPVFVVGHWRSGTTHLHNLLGCSKEFGIISPLASGLPWELLTLATWLRPWLEKALPEDRGVDKVAVTPQSPQEDEIPLANMQRLSVYHATYFPKQFQRLFDEGVFFEGVSDKEVANWRRSIEYFLRKVSRHQGEKTLLIKNPVYTARIDELRKIWPDAKFIHIYRNPYEVFTSTMHYFRKMLPELALQSYDLDAIEPLVLNAYPRMMDELERSAADLPESQYAQVRFEELEDNPLPELERLHRQLDLPQWDETKPRVEGYLGTICEYKKNKFDYPADVCATVEKHWGKYLTKFGYNSPNKAAG